MRIKKIHIQNYKSLVDFELDSPPPFCAFVGPNASGKSNIFEALEFTNYTIRFGAESPAFFKGKDAILPFVTQKPENEGQVKFSVDFKTGLKIGFGAVFSNNDAYRDMLSVTYELHDQERYNKGLVLGSYDIKSVKKRSDYINRLKERKLSYENEYEIFIDRYSRIFVGSNKFIPAPSINKLTFNASNLSQIIGQIFQDERKREDFIEWVQILIPEFKNIEVKKSNIDGSYEFFVYEKSSDKPFPKHLISDGTYNILALMAAVYQSSEPQFLCIEEPENGLHPQAIELLVEFFREKCEDEGHHIWLNTHSPTLVRCMAIDEIVLVNKVNGQTRAKIDFKKKGIDIKTDEAWLTNSLGGGTL